MKRPAFALAALAAATIALAQTTPSSPAEPPASTTPQERTTPPPDSGSRASDADMQALMKDCVTQVQAANPSVSAQDVQAYCEKQIASYSASPRR